MRNEKEFKNEKEVLDITSRVENVGKKVHLTCAVYNDVFRFAVFISRVRIQKAFKQKMHSQGDAGRTSK